MRPIIIIILIIAVIYFLTIIGVFKIKKIEVENELKYMQNINQITNQYIGKGYFSLNLENLEKDIKEGRRYVKNVSAEKIFPNKILLDIEEYKPMFFLEYKNICYIFSEEGIVLEEETEYEKCSLDSGILLTADTNILAEDKLIFDKELYEIVKVLEEFGWDIKTIILKENVLEVTDNDKKIIIEINQEYEEQLSKLYLVLEKVNIEGIEYKSLDLRFERPVMELL
jgi:hypothetical protein